ncbi:lantibiotic protection ABC transporter ATP-binding subunit [Anaerococcus sp. mt242]|uniref:lantibiotic protection ABC transporter ATP-binding subunit n=1 Tax=Anaerococcus sp. mt242 TaxID=2661917 RepID=UPI001934A4F1|nr:lantibiotic protection ABC transporter ATP-binding subunit [Anaerococcus sp. mt242]MBM0045556.1 lantibiotic protection ABC transporter ATP-binding subunit [Anaerococcus sp. mt242]
MTNIIETKNLTKQFKGFKALDNVSINIEEGKVYGLLGPNGAGKSTFLKLITQIIKPSSGEIVFKNHQISQNDLRQIGAIIENPAIYPNLTAYENLKVLTTLLSIDENKINEVLKTVDLTNTGNKLAREFSLGMKQRLGIAMALINNPKLLILDEPTNGLDPVGIAKLRELIKSFTNDGITVLISSHILSEIDQVADKVGILVNGKLAYEGENDKGSDHLENLFMDIIKKEGF